MNGAQALVAALEAEGVRTLFGYPGGAIMPFYDALLGSQLRHVLVRHEQAAAMAADGFARVSGEVGVCVATSGPGATNLITGIANAWMDSVPMVAITGQVPRAVMGTDAFQEVDVLGCTLPIVKHSWLVRDSQRIAEVVHEAFALAREGRPGPVLIDIPKDVLQGELTAVEEPAAPKGELASDKPEHLRPGASDLAHARQLLAASRRPLVYAGGGVALAGAVEPLRAFVARTGIPAVHTLKGVGLFEPQWPQSLGMLGMHGTQAANHAVQEADLLLVAGARFDDRATGRLSGFAPGAKVIHLDVDPAEVSKLRRADVGLLGSMSASLEALAADLWAPEPWRSRTRALRAEFPTRYDAPGESIYAPALLRDLSEQAARDGEHPLLVACDVGQHQMWVAQHMRFAHPRHHLSSGGLGAMGYGLPAAIGAQLARPDARALCVSGDGSIMMNIQELLTVRRYELPIKVLLLDNGCLGMVRQWQELFFSQRYSEVELWDNPDFAELARAMGMPAFSVSERSEIPGAINRLLNEKGPLFCHARIDPRANVWPLIPPGAASQEMMAESASHPRRGPGQRQGQGVRR